VVIAEELDPGLWMPEPEWTQSDEETLQMAWEMDVERINQFHCVPEVMVVSSDAYDQLVDMLDDNFKPMGGWNGRWASQEEILMWLNGYATFNAVETDFGLFIKPESTPTCGWCDYELEDYICWDQQCPYYGMEPESGVH
jgi:hypothetical protein